VPITVAVAVALSSLSELTLVAVALAVLLSGPGLVVKTLMVSIAPSPAPRPPTLHVTVPPLLLFGPLQAPWLVDAETKWALAGSGSVTVVPVALDPPMLVAKTV
jgi:hypothetical protein